MLRAAIEQHAVGPAMDHYRGLGYEVRDLGTFESFDIHAVRSDEELHIEVKGSKSTADSVQLTKNEVEHAHRERSFCADAEA